MMHPAYGKGIFVPQWHRLVRGHEKIEPGDTFMADVEDDPIPVEHCIGMAVDETPFVAVFRKEAPCSTS